MATFVSQGFLRYRNRLGQSQLTEALSDETRNKTHAPPDRSPRPTTTKVAVEQGDDLAADCTRGGRTATLNVLGNYSQGLLHKGLCDRPCSNRLFSLKRQGLDSKRNQGLARTTRVWWGG